MGAGARFDSDLQGLHSLYWGRHRKSPLQVLAARRLARGGSALLAHLTAVYDRGLNVGRLLCAAIDRHRRAHWSGPG